ncbi:hypothetical protein [Bifidobacterium pseudocatenulatum]|nr:hypothetical protein [Bifidobacterium pseudocatenulatum]
MSLLSLSVDASMTVREVMAVAYLIGRRDALRDVRNASSPARTVNRRLIHGGPSDCVFNRGYEAGAGMVSDEIDALMRDVEALSGDDAVFSMLRHPSVSGVMSGGIGDPAVRGARSGLFRPAAAVPASGSRHRASRGPSAGLPRAINGGGPMMHLILVIAVVIILAASYLLTFALCRAATRRDMLEARWREESAGSVSEESHESA